MDDFPLLTDNLATEFNRTPSVDEGKSQNRFTSTRNPKLQQSNIGNWVEIEKNGKAAEDGDDFEGEIEHDRSSVGLQVRVADAHKMLNCNVSR